jgi:magnesium transporter
MIWHDIRDPNDPELDRLAALHGLHPLHIEDCRHRRQNAKLEDNGQYLFVVLKPLEIAKDGSLDFEDLDFFLGRDFLITVVESECHTVRQLLDGLKTSAVDLRADQLFYRIMDRLVDSYPPVLDRFSQTVDSLEEEALDVASPETLSRLFSTRRNLIELRRVLSNSRDVAGHLQRLRSELVGQDLWPFLRDVYDHLARNLDTIDVQRELLTAVVEVYMSTVANRTNNVMKALTVLGTIALPALVISSFYGMNLKSLPAVEWPHATAVVILFMIASTAGLLWLLRKYGWF